MSEMIERVARAICAVEEPEFDPGIDDHGREPALWTKYVLHALAAIASMREPTEAMLEAVRELDDPVMSESWRAMIDAALATPAPDCKEPTP